MLNIIICINHGFSLVPVLDVESNEVVDHSETLRENDIPENVEIIDTTNVGNEDVEIYESEEGYVEAEYSPDGGIQMFIISFYLKFNLILSIMYILSRFSFFFFKSI